MSTRKCGLSLHVVEQGTDRNTASKGYESIAEIGAEIDFNPSILDTYRYEGWKAVHYDLLVLCAAVEYADRRCARHRTRWSRHFQITLPSLDPAMWKQKGVRLCLQDTLRQLTGDNWDLSFVQSETSALNVMRQRMLLFPNKKDCAIAYSDGLDSRCVSGLFDTADSVVRVRVTKNRDRVKDGERPFDRIPFSVRLAPSRESNVRSRGFKFAAITAIAAHISGVHRIIVPESGQGALGPVLLPLHNIYPDYRNHPIFFRKMERFIDALLGYSVEYQQPRLWYTKGETIETFLLRSEIGRQSVLNTHSCWQQRWNARSNGVRRHCGLCVACLLRRMSMHTAKVAEPADTYLFSNLLVARYEEAALQNRGVRLSGTMVEYGIVGVRHLQQLADMSTLSATALRPHVCQIARSTYASEEFTHRALKRLLQQHGEEWLDFVGAQGRRSFITKWAKVGHHARPE